MKTVPSLLVALLPAVALAKNSAGCGKSASISAGKTTSMSGTFDGTKRTWLAYLPKNYDKSKAYPLVVSTHGWGGDAAEDEADSGLSLTSAGGGDFIAIFPDGLADNPNRGAWGSWNCVGTILSPGPQGQTCTSWADPDNSYCYTSCGGSKGCKGAAGCDWTTCKSDITPTGIGTSDVTGFIPQLYDYIEANFCVDTAREYHSGMSNGAMFTYQTGVSMASRVAAIVPVAGSFHKGFLQTPATKVPLLDLHGTKDKEVPCNTSTSQDGWYFELQSSIIPAWAKANGCSRTSLTAYKAAGVTSANYAKFKLSCASHGCDTVTCAWNGAHDYFGDAGQWGGGKSNGDLVYGFFEQYTKSSHIGFARTAGGNATAAPAVPLPTDVAAHRAFEPATARNFARAVRFDSSAFAPAAPAPGANGTHYADPATGCQPDEEELTFEHSGETGRVCAPKKTTAGAAAGAAAPCGVGGVSPSKNGCPTDTPGAARGKRAAWPICLSYPTAGEDYHCMLVCDPCRVGDTECSQEADDMCPKGAKCQVGFMKNMRQGLCVYSA
eukprot:g1511.t1